MTNKILRGIILVPLLLVFHLSYAQVVVNEIMYNPVPSDSYNEWIEILNSGPSDVDLATLTICGKGIKAGYIKRSDGATYLDAGLTLAGGQYAVITDGPASGTEVYDNFSVATGALALHIDGSASICSDLSNDGKTISLGGPSTDSVTYDPSQGANNDGNSLQRQTDGSWAALVPTPGASNSGGGGGGGGDSSGSSSSGGSSASSVTTTQTAPAPPPKITAKIISKTSVVAGVPLYFEVKATGLSGEPLTRGKFSWSFGDGGSLETFENTKFAHTFYYPGDYVVILEYSQSYYAQAPDATDRLTIRVLPAGIAITSFGPAPDFPVELFNSAAYEMDISGWLLQSSAKSFRLPQNTFILPSKKIILSGRLTGFTAEDAKTLKLVLPGGDLVFDYDASLVPPPPAPEEPVSYDPPPAEFSRSSGRVASEVPPLAEQTKLAQPDTQKLAGGSVSESQDLTLESENLTAAVAEAVPNKTSGKVWPWLLGTIGVAGLAAAAVLLSKGNLLSATSAAPKPSDKFELLDE